MWSAPRTDWNMLGLCTLNSVTRIQSESVLLPLMKLSAVYVQLLCQCSETHCQTDAKKSAFSSTTRGQNDEGAFERATATRWHVRGRGHTTQPIAVFALSRQAGACTYLLERPYKFSPLLRPFWSCLTSTPYPHSIRLLATCKY